MEPLEISEAFQKIEYLLNLSFLDWVIIETTTNEMSTTKTYVLDIVPNSKELKKQLLDLEMKYFQVSSARIIDKKLIVKITQLMKVPVFYL